MSTTFDVTITSTPSGAEVVHGSRVLGKTPYRGALSRKSGETRLTVQLRGYQSQSVTVSPDGAKRRDVKLAPAAHDKVINPF